ncbi:MAG: 2-dehydro-3-deoxygalactonokinase [Burkholderiaceae bacterium]
MRGIGSASQQVALVGVDWGTSSLRLVAMNSRGEVIATSDSAQGISRVTAGQFDAALEAALQPWTLPGDIPLILSGMIGSRNGWVEAPYIPAPAALSQLADGLARHQTRSGRNLYFVPGVKLDGSSAQADVMRGEETELLGWFETNPDAGTRQDFVMPGTHCKWVEVVDRSITRFRTCMTGEVFAILCDNSILGRLMTPADAPAQNFQAGAAFMQGATIGLREPEALLANLFSARVMPLLELMPATDVREYLTGLLIGSEVAGLAGHVVGPVVVIGRGELSERYVRILELAGIAARAAAAGSAVSGQLAIARKAGLVAE